MTDTGYSAYSLTEYPFRPPPELEGSQVGTYRCVILGAGLAGLTLAADLGLRGVPVTVIDQDATSGAEGIVSRGVGYANRSIEIFDRLGIADEIAAKAVTWNEGRIFDGHELIHHYFIQPEQNRKWPAFLNIQQFHIEQFLVSRIAELDNVDIRWQSRVVNLRQDEDGVFLEVETPMGAYSLRADWLAACDGSHSPAAGFLSLEPELDLIDDHWAYADIRIDWGGLQRRFWLNLPELGGGAAIVHAMADGCVRYDWQIHNLDPATEVTPERVTERITAMLDGRTDFEIVAIGRVRLKRKILSPMLSGRVIFVGDSAHVLPPYGARGGNSAIEDATNLGWKLAAVVHGHVNPALLGTYNAERLPAAVENARIAVQSAGFIHAHTHAEHLFRDAILTLARDHEFARRLINTGRPITPGLYAASRLTVEDQDDFNSDLMLGAVAPSAPIAEAGVDGYLLDVWRGNFTALYFTDEWSDDDPFVVEIHGFQIDHVIVTRNPGLKVPGARVLIDTTGMLFDQYDAEDGACYVLRPDAHVAGRSRAVSVAAAADIVSLSLQRATALDGAEVGS